MRLPPSFLHKILRPGRYLGRELGVPGLKVGDGARPHVWFYPGSYEMAMADTEWRRGFFQLNDQPGLLCLRGIEFAADVWPLFEAGETAPFSIDGQCDLREAATIVFWAPDVFATARIPSILARLNLGTGPKVGVVVSGWAAPRFLRGYADWVLPAPSGWLPASLIDLLQDGKAPEDNTCYTRDLDNWDAVFSGDIRPIPLLPYHPVQTPQWVSKVDAGTGHNDLELHEVSPDGHLSVRSIQALVADAQASLRSTGLDGLRICDSGFDAAHTIVSTLIELARTYNTKRIELQLPALIPDDFAKLWQAYKPHLIKPVLPLRMRVGNDPATLISLGHRALNDGWHGLTLVLAFDSGEHYEALLPGARKVIEGWDMLASTFNDKRPLRVKYQPAPIGQWLDSPSGPSEDDFYRIGKACRHGQESFSGKSSFEHFHIVDIFARNWLAATDHDVWPELAKLNLSDQNNDAVPPFDWSGWVRNCSGLTKPPEREFSRRKGSPVAPMKCTSDAGPQHLAATPAMTTADASLYGRRSRRGGFTRRLSAPSLTRLRVCWGKTPAWQYYSHLDMVRAIERAIRMSGLPASYSEGYHPRLKLSFGPPLAFGLVTRAEYFDLLLERDVTTADADALRAVLPDGIFVNRAEAMPGQMPSLTEMLNEAVYTAMVPVEPQAAQDAIQHTLSQPRITWTRTDRPNRPPVDPRNSLKSTAIEIKPEGVEWSLTLSLGGPGSIRPDDWAALLFGLDSDQRASLIIERTDLLVRQGDRTRSPFEFP